jgi:hypothetical protein
VSKFNPIWCPIAQELRWRRKGPILDKNRASRDLQSDTVWLYRTKSENFQTLSDLGFQPDVRAPFWPQFAIRVSD